MAKHPGGRPKKQIDFDLLERLCTIQCTQEEIASVLGVSIDVIEARLREKYDQSFPEYFAQKRGGGKVSLRRKQMEVAMAGDKTMLVWLGKQYLHQADKTDSNVNMRINSWDDLEAEIAAENGKGGE